MVRMDVCISLRDSARTVNVNTDGSANQLRHMSRRVKINRTCSRCWRHATKCGPSP